MGKLHLLLLWAVAAPAAAATFQGLGDLPGGSFDSSASGISADGAIVVGFSSSTAGSEAFVWNPIDGMWGIGDLDGGEFASSANAASADGAVVVGSGTPGACCEREAFRWTAEGMVGLGDLPGGTANSIATDVSDDGSVVVGRGQSAAGTEAFRWTPDGGMVGLGDLAGGSFLSNAEAVSADGSIVAGSSRSGSGSEAFVWDATNGMQALGLLPTYEQCFADGISADGAVVVGHCDDAVEFAFEAFRWDAVNGMQGLGDLFGGEIQSFPLDTTHNGSVVVGQGGSFHHRVAFTWDAVNGMRELQSVLETEYGLDLSDWTLVTATSIADDGTAIAGWGYNFAAGQTEAWIAMPEPTSWLGLAVGTVLLAALAPRRER